MFSLGYGVIHSMKSLSIAVINNTNKATPFQHAASALQQLEKSIKSQNQVLSTRARSLLCHTSPESRIVRVIRISFAQVRM